MPVSAVWARGYGFSDIITLGKWYIKIRGTHLVKTGNREPMICRRISKRHAVVAVNTLSLLLANEDHEYLLPTALEPKALLTIFWISGSLICKSNSSVSDGLLVFLSIFRINDFFRYVCSHLLRDEDFIDETNAGDCDPLLLAEHRYRDATHRQHQRFPSCRASMLSRLRI